MKNMLLLAFVLLGLFVFQSEPYAQLDKAKIQLTGSTLHVEGDITSDTAKSIRSIYNDVKFTKIDITSHGGLMDAGMDIAAFVQDNNISVNVDNYCYSACTFMFVISPNPTMGDKAIIGIHNILLSPSTGLSQYTLVTLDSSIQMAQNVAVSTGVMFGLYASAGIPGDVLMQAAEMYGKNMVSLHKDDMIRYGIVQK